MAEQPPLDLRSLAEVHSPEVVRSALASFRRRVLVRTLWGPLALLVGASAIYALASPRNLRTEIDGARIVSYPRGGSWDVAGTRVVLLEVADLGAGKIGLDLALAPDPRVVAQYHLVLSGSVATDQVGLERWVELGAPADGRISARVFRTGRCASAVECNGSFTIDLAALNVPPDMWR
jgi:hypothetical protein